MTVRGCQAAAWTLAAVLGACDSPDPAPGRAARAPQDVRSTVIRWMECNDCQAGELDSVVALGDSAIPVLARFLIEGPTPDRRTVFERRLDSTYGRREQHGGMAMTPVQFRRVYGRGFLVTYQTRSARALGKIDGPAALDTLRAAPYDSVASPVQAAIRCALDSLCRR